MRYLYRVELTIDVPNEPGESCDKSRIFRVVATDVQGAIETAIAILPVTVATTVSVPDPPYRVAGKTRPIKSAIITSCTKISPVDAVREDNP